MGHGMRELVVVSDDPDSDLAELARSSTPASWLVAVVTGEQARQLSADGFSLFDSRADVDAPTAYLCQAGVCQLPQNRSRTAPGSDYCSQLGASRCHWDNVSVLVVAATPIGNLADHSPRLVETLQDADLIVAEDTRTTRSLINKLEIAVSADIRPLHEHNETAVIDSVLATAARGLVVPRERCGNARHFRPRLPLGC